jgi:hypothetical protein
MTEGGSGSVGHIEAQREDDPSQCPRQAFPVPPGHSEHRVSGSPVPASQRPDFRTLSLDSQQFLNHALSVDGEELQAYLESQAGASFGRLSVSPTKQRGEHLQSPLGVVSMDSDGKKLADMMHSLLDDPNFDVGGELLTADTLDKVLGEEIQAIADEVRDMNSHRDERIQDGSGDAMPPPAPRGIFRPTHTNPVAPPPMNKASQNMHVAKGSVGGQKNQYITFMDGDMLQREDGSPAIVSFPEGSMAAALQVPIPGSNKHLQYVPLLNSALAGNTISPPNLTMGNAGNAGDQEAVGLLSPSQTERMVEHAANLHSELQGQQRRSGELKPTLRQVDSSELIASKNESGMLEDACQLSERKMSHKRDRSITLQELPGLMPSAKAGTANSVQALSSNFYSETIRGSLNQLSPNSPMDFHRKDSVGRGAHNDRDQQDDDPRTQITAYIKPLRLFTNGLSDFIDEEISQIIQQTLETPPGQKRRGRPPGRSKNVAEVLPDGWVEPTDAEILANLLLDKPHMKKMTSDELKKSIRKEKNKISAAMSRVRLQNETRDLEGQIRKLEEEHSNLSEWLSSGTIEGLGTNQTVVPVSGDRANPAEEGTDTIGTNERELRNPMHAANSGPIEEGAQRSQLIRHFSL